MAPGKYSFFIRSSANDSLNQIHPVTTTNHFQFLVAEACFLHFFYHSRNVCAVLQTYCKGIFLITEGAGSFVIQKFTEVKAKCQMLYTILFAM